jgi:biopolymer transport protein ExbD
MQATGCNIGGDELRPLIARKQTHDEAEFDITAMVDPVLMMNIYFLVAFLTAAAAEINLPTASHVAALDADTAITLTVMGTLDGKGAQVYLGDGTKGQAITDPEEQTDRVRKAAEEAVAAGKKAVLIKAEKKVRLKDLFRISTAAAIEGIKLNVGVTEGDVGR